MELPAQLTINGVLHTITGIHPDDGATGSLTYDTPTATACGRVFATSQNGKTVEEVTEADVIAALEATPPAAPSKQSARVVLDRLTTQERAALHTARQSSAELDAFVLKAVSEGVISEADPEFDAAVTALDAAGIIAANRWATLLA